MAEIDVVIGGIAIGIVVFAIIVILLAKRNAGKGAAIYEMVPPEPKPEKPDEYPREKNRPIGDVMAPSMISFCTNCGQRLKGYSFFCPYCHKKL